MEEQISKFVLCVLCTQLGKTFTAIERIQHELEEDETHGKSLHIIATMNSLLNNEQFSSRLNHIENTYGKNSVCIFASKYKGTYKHIKNREELQGICLDETTCPRVIVMCSNTIRFEDEVEFIKVMNRNQTPIRRIFTYYDELHDYISETLRTQLEEIHSLPIVKGILALTATPDKIWKKEGFWSKLRIIQLHQYNDSNYVGYKDMQFQCVDDCFEEPYVRPRLFDYDEMDRQTVDYIRHVLQSYPEIIGPNTFTFIPAHKRRSSHYTVRELVVSTNPECVVVMINANEKTIQFTNGLDELQIVPLISEYKITSKGLEIEEVCDTIARMVEEYELKSRPIVVTGLVSVSMGQTLTHPKLGSFTSAIFSHLDLTNDEIYQLFGRITGRMKQWSTYVPTTVYCPTPIMYRCKMMEMCARNMVCHNGSMITQEEYRNPIYTDGERCVISNIRDKKVKKVNPEHAKFERGYRVFVSKEEMDLFAMEHLGATRKSNKYNTNDEGFKVCSQSVVKVHKTEDIIQHFEKSTVGSNMDKKLEDVQLGEYAYRRYVCYDSLTDISSEKFVVCWFKRIVE